MNFIGRKEELEKLNRAMQTDEMNFSLIYGRRRVGKSELVSQALSKVGSKKYIMNVNKLRRKVM